MKALGVFLIGVTAGVGVVRLTEGITSSQARLMCFFLMGVLLGVVAAAICFWGWKE